MKRQHQHQQTPFQWVDSFHTTHATTYTTGWRKGFNSRRSVTFTSSLDMMQTTQLANPSCTSPKISHCANPLYLLRLDLPSALSLFSLPPPLSPHLAKITNAKGFRYPLTLKYKSVHTQILKEETSLDSIVQVLLINQITSFFGGVGWTGSGGVEHNQVPIYTPYDSL